MSKLKLILIALLIGIINAVVFVIFEFIVTQGTNYLWNDFLNTGENRIAVVPVAILLSILFSAVVKFFKQKRVVSAEANLFDDNEVKPTGISDLAAIFVIGCASLLAGASLGPEASLVGIASGLGIWFAQRSKNMETAKLLALSSVGALLVAFLGSLFPILIPILVLYKKEKKIVPMHIILPVISGVFAYVTLVAIKGSAIGFGTIPVGSNNYTIQDLIAAFFLGILGSLFALILKALIDKFGQTAKNINSKTHWIVSAAVFGSVIGIIYLIGGQSVEFSGKEGVDILLHNNSYSLIALLVIVIAKLIATGWSLPSGYRGGLVFPSVFMGVAISLIFEKIDPVLTGSGIMIGSISGIFTALINPILGFILILSMIPVQLVWVAVAGLFGALIGEKVTKKVVEYKRS